MDGLQLSAMPPGQPPQPDSGEAALARLKTAIRQCAYVDGSQQTVVSPSGKRQKWMLDMRAVFMDTALLAQIAEEFWDRFAARLPFQLAGLEVAAIPLMTALLLQARQRGLDVTGVILRKERKTSGLGRSIEGTLSDLPVVLVDDVLNSGASVEKARVVLAAAKARIGHVFVVVDYQSGEGLKWRNEHGLSVSSLFTLADFGLGLHRATSSISQKYERLWHFVSPSAYPYHVVPKSSPLLVNNRIFMGSDTGKMWALDAATGQDVWCFEAKGTHDRKGIWSSPCHHDGRIYFGAYNGDVYCLDAASGTAIWTLPCCEWIGSSPVTVPRHNLVFIGLEYERPRKQGSVVALSMSTGEKVWEYWLDKYQHGSAAYWESGDLVIFGTNDHNVIALDAASGRLVWEFKTRRSVKYPPFVDPERELVSFASFDGSIYILSVATGELRLEVPTDNICYTTPLIVGSRLFCGSGDRHLYVVDLDEMCLIKKLDAGARIYSPPKPIGKHIIFGSNSGRVYELDVETLRVKGVVQLPDAVTNGIAVNHDGTRIYASTYMNEIYAYQRG